MTRRCSGGVPTAELGPFGAGDSAATECKFPERFRDISPSSFRADNAPL